MTAAVLTESAVGAVIGPSNHASGLVCGIYSATKVSQNDWIIFDDFTAVKECVAYTVSSGARTAETFTVDTTTLNKVVLTSANTGAVSIIVWGTPA